MLKMADACQRAGGQSTTSATRFHELHVQRHNNVSILYADIVNFTPLSEQLTASDLVKTLNDLFGRFDQIAQVSIDSYTNNTYHVPFNVRVIGARKSYIVPIEPLDLNRITVSVTAEYNALDAVW